MGWKAHATAYPTTVSAAAPRIPATAEHAHDALPRALAEWFSRRAWTPFGFQLGTWRAYREGRSGLVHAPTGMGKTLAVWLGPVMEHLNTPRPAEPEPIRVLWITPMRALATDTTQSLAATAGELGLHWTIEKRTSDSASSVKLRQRDRLPTALVTTPESLSLLLSYPNARELFASLRCVVVDEWHELLSTKRGTQTELCLARLRGWAPTLRTWGLSATLGNIERAAEALVGAGRDALLIRGEACKDIRVRTIIPPDMARFPWAGHLGLRLLGPVLAEVERAATSLLFTNTRMQAELWFRAIIEARPEWMGEVAIHHGSLDRDVRAEVEDLIRAGALRCVVCTSSLDLGVDFSPVDQVIQVGSPKGVARLMQRAGRSGHRPGAASAVVCVPTNALELIEIAAARSAIGANAIEDREPLERPLDVLVQHLVTAALGGGFEEEEMLAEVRSARAYRDLSRDEWRWCLDFVKRGGSALGAYPRFSRVEPGEGGRLFGARSIERMHRLNIGTISSESAIKVKYAGGKVIGTTEEGFIARLRPGDRFVLGGRPLELVRVREMTAEVRRAKDLRGVVPRWDGGKSPLSTELSGAVRRKLHEEGDEPEMHAVRPLLRIQRTWSRIPTADELLIESIETDEGFHVFVYPFEGRLVHEGLGALAAHRLARERPRTMTVSMNDYGFELLADRPLPTDEASWRRLLSLDSLLDDLLSCLNSTELTRRQFRGVARVAGLIVPGFPGAARSARQVQASSELFYDVFSEFDPGNRLLDQARREVMEQQLEVGRLRSALMRIAGHRMVMVGLERLSPMSFPLWAESLRTQHVSSETWAERVRKMAVRLEEEADEPRRPGLAAEVVIKKKAGRQKASRHED